MADRSRSRSPQRDEDNVPSHHDDNGHQGGRDNGEGSGEEVKLYVGNLNYGTLSAFSF